MLVIPSIDISGEKCVRLRQGDFQRLTIYPGSPAEVAAQFAGEGASTLHVVDLDGARQGHVENWKAIGEIASIQGVKIQAGGGVRTLEDVERLFSMGIDRVVLGSVATTDFVKTAEWAKLFGPGRFCIALDMKDGKLVSHGWLKTEANPMERVMENLNRSGFHWILSTDVGRDGMLEGPNIPHYQALVERYPQVSWIASGGVRSQEDIRSLRHAGVKGAIVGRAVYEGVVTVRELMS